MRKKKLNSELKQTLGSLREFQSKQTFAKASKPTDLIVLDILDAEEDFVILFSCRHFLEHAICQKKTDQPSFFCLDATFNVVKNNYKLIVIGTESPNHSFRIIALALSLYEDQVSYEFSLKTVKDILWQHYRVNYQPQFSMSDSHPGALAAIKAIFPNVKRLRCYFHIMQNVDRKLKTLDLKKEQPYVNWVMKTLKEAPSEEKFIKTWKLFKPEILRITKSEELVNYLEKNMVESEAKWYQGASFLGKQKCNNSLESINRYIKERCTNGENKSVGTFFLLMKKAMVTFTDACKEETCMDTSCKFLRTYYQKASEIIDKNQAYQFSENTLAFIRIPERFKSKNNEEENKNLIIQRLSKVHERLVFARANLSDAYANLMTFTKIHSYFRFYNFDARHCSCTTFANRKICKHQLVTDMKTGKTQNPYEQKLVKAKN